MVRSNSASSGSTAAALRTAAMSIRAVRAALGIGLRYPGHSRSKARPATAVAVGRSDARPGKCRNSSASKHGRCQMMVMSSNSAMRRARSARRRSSTAWSSSRKTNMRTGRMRLLRCTPMRRRAISTRDSGSPAPAQILDPEINRKVRRARKVLQQRSVADFRRPLAADKDRAPERNMRWTTPHPRSGIPP